MQQFQSSQRQVFRKFFPEIKQEITNKAFILIFPIKEIKEQYLNELNAEHREKKGVIVNTKYFFLFIFFCQGKSLKAALALSSLEEKNVFSLA